MGKPGHISQKYKWKSEQSHWTSPLIKKWKYNSCHKACNAKAIVRSWSEQIKSMCSEGMKEVSVQYCTVTTLGDVPCPGGAVAVAYSPNCPRSPAPSSPNPPPESCFFRKDVARSAGHVAYAADCPVSPGCASPAGPQSHGHVTGPSLRLTSWQYSIWWRSRWESLEVYWNMIKQSICKVKLHDMFQELSFSYRGRESTSLNGPCHVCIQQDLSEIYGIYLMYYRQSCIDLCVFPLPCLSE